MISRPPSYLSCASLARELDVSESTIHEMVRRGVLPKPVRLSGGCVRWCWADVEAAIASLKHGTDTAPADPFLAGVRNVSKASEGRRGTP
jgi:predicted DNA-binding transcriptional regulator AlpA